MQNLQNFLIKIEEKDMKINKKKNKQSIKVKQINCIIIIIICKENVFSYDLKNFTNNEIYEQR